MDQRIQEIAATAIKSPGHQMAAAKHLQYLSTGRQTLHKKSPLKIFGGDFFLINPVYSVTLMIFLYFLFPFTVTIRMYIPLGKVCTS